MTATKKRIYLSVLGVGLCVLLYDFVSGDDLPKRAEASDSDQPPALDSTGAGSDADLALLSVAPFPRALPKATLAAETRDLFVPSPSVLNEFLGPEEEETKEGDREAGVPLAPPVPFGEQHRLSAIIDIAGSRGAIVDGKMLREGQLLSDCVVVAIEDRNVRFDCNGVEEELRLDRSFLSEQSAE